MELEVKDMSCGGCANAITRAVTTADPQATVHIDVAKKVVAVDSAMSPGMVIATIEAAGFHPTVRA